MVSELKLISQLQFTAGHRPWNKSKANVGIFVTVGCSDLNQSSLFLYIICESYTRKCCYRVRYVYVKFAFFLWNRLQKRMKFSIRLFFHSNMYIFFSFQVHMRTYSTMYTSSIMCSTRSLTLLKLENTRITVAQISISYTVYFILAFFVIYYYNLNSYLIYLFT